MTDDRITHDELLARINYESDYGSFVPRGDFSFERHVDASGYEYLLIDGKLYRCDILACFYMNRVWPKCFHIIHRDGDAKNLKWENLQDPSIKGAAKIKRQTATGVRGVYTYKDKYRAVIRLKNGPQVITKHLGVFDTISEARIAFENAIKARENQEPSFTDHN